MFLFLTYSPVWSVNRLCRTALKGNRIITVRCHSSTPILSIPFESWSTDAYLLTQNTHSNWEPHW